MKNNFRLFFLRHRVGYMSKVGETSSETRKYKATRLTEGTEYAFRVAAENTIGVGAFATIDKPVKADVPFGQFISSLVSMYFVPTKF